MGHSLQTESMSWILSFPRKVNLCLQAAMRLGGTRAVLEGGSPDLFLYWQGVCGQQHCCGQLALFSPVKQSLFLATGVE